MMYTSVILILYVLSCHTVSINRQTPHDIISKTQTELTPIRIPCELTDIIIISAPIIAQKNPVYHLYNPRGEFSPLNLSLPVYNKTDASDYETLNIKTNKDYLIITQSSPYSVFNVLTDDCLRGSSQDVFSCKQEEMKANEFMIGPLGEDDYGNWVLSAFWKDKNGEWEEVYKVITLEIIETVPPLLSKSTLKPGGTFEISFAYPIKHLESCELVVPKSTFDRFYSRNPYNLEKCGFVVKNLTLADAGLWKIRAVGRISYEATLSLVIL